MWEKDYSVFYRIFTPATRGDFFRSITLLLNTDIFSYIIDVLDKSPTLL